ncbi:MAG: polysaccharide pyruvyl transferase family protein [Parvibaculum sp.]
MANLAIVRSVAAEFSLVPEVVIIGMRDRGAAYVAEQDASTFEVDTRSLLSPTGCWRVIGAQDCLLDIGAGDSFADIYGFKRFAFLWITKAMAILRGKPLVLSPQTIGPFARAPYVQLARFALTRARTVVARDDASFAFLREIAPSANGVLSVDVAFALPFEDRSAERNRPGRVRVGVNVSGLLFNEALSGRNRFGLDADYGQLMRLFIAELVGREDVEVHLITHAIGHGPDDDGEVADRLAEEFPAVIRVPDFATPSAAKSYISGLDFLVAGRMHACIAAVSARTAVVPIAYSRKFSGLFGMLNYNWILPEKGMSTQEALAFLLSCLSRRTDLAEDAVRAMSKVDALLEVYRNELRALFRSLGARA